MCVFPFSLDFSNPRAPKTPETENPRIHIERSGGGCVRRSSVTTFTSRKKGLWESNYQTQPEGKWKRFVSGHSEDPSECEGQPWEFVFKFVGCFSCVKPQFGQVSGIENCREISWNLWMRIDELAVTRHSNMCECFTASPAAPAQGNYSCQNVENFWEYAIASLRVSGLRGFWFLSKNALLCGLAVFMFLRFGLSEFRSAPALFDFFVGSMFWFGTVAAEVESEEHHLTRLDSVLRWHFWDIFGHLATPSLSSSICVFSLYNFDDCSLVLFSPRWS